MKLIAVLLSGLVRVHNELVYVDGWCNTSKASFSIENIQCGGMRATPAGGANFDACERACCSQGSRCKTFLFGSAEAIDHGCWTSDAGCQPMVDPPGDGRGWFGASVLRAPPPPAPPPPPNAAVQLIYGTPDCTGTSSKYSEYPYNKCVMLVGFLFASTFPCPSKATTLMGIYNLALSSYSLALLFLVSHHFPTTRIRTYEAPERLWVGLVQSMCNF